MSIDQSEYSAIKHINSSQVSNMDIPQQTEIHIESDNISFN